jgi:hypothetical protein
MGAISTFFRDALGITSGTLLRDFIHGEVLDFF